MRRYRILLVVRHPVGGIRTFFKYFYKAFCFRRYAFTLVAPKLPETGVLREDLGELDLSYIPVDATTSNWQLLQCVTRIIAGGRFDLIHSHGFTSGACAAIGAFIKRTPHILTCHDVFSKRQFSGFRGILRKVALGAVLPTIDRIHCVSYDARENLLQHLPTLRLRRQHVIAIPNGIEVERFIEAAPRDLRRELGLPTGSFLIGFVGRLMAQKGFRYLIDAIDQLNRLENLPKKPLVLIVGQPDGFIREEQMEIERRGLAESFFFLPFVPDVASTLKGLDVIAVPSLWEACPLLPMETMVAGVPLIGTSCIGLREVLWNTPATIVPPGDSVALAEALIAEMRNPTIGRAREFAEQAAARFQVKERAADLEKVLLGLMEK